jgi:hypothetical protein
MFESFSASGFFVQTPFGPRKSGMPDSVEMPAPVSATVRHEDAIHEDTTASSSDIDQVYVGSGFSRILKEPDSQGAGFSRSRILKLGQEKRAKESWASSTRLGAERAYHEIRHSTQNAPSSQSHIKSLRILRFLR